MKSSLLISVAFTLLAAASPAERAPLAGPIPLRKRSGLTTTDGVFDKDKAVIENVLTRNKHRQNLLNLKKNTGELTKGQKIYPLAIVPTTVQSRVAKRQAEPLTDENSDVEWAGPVTIGTPGKTKFLIDWDTGSSDLWVPSFNCTSATCASKKKYNPNTSSTSVKHNGSFEIQYGDGSSVSGPIYQDTVRVAGLTVPKQYFSAVTTLSSAFANDPVDGVLGLAFPALSNIGKNPFFYTAISSGAVKAKTFGFYLASTGSELFFGGTNTKLHTAMEYHRIDTSTGFWQVTGGKALVGNTTAATGFEAVIDSGTTIMYGPPAAVEAFYSKVPGSNLSDPTNGFYSFPCSSVPHVSFNFGGKNWSISTANFNLGTTSAGASTCVGALAGQDLGLGDNVWLLGDSFMKNVYTAFNVGNLSVGFGAHV